MSGFLILSDRVRSPGLATIVVGNLLVAPLCVTLIQTGYVPSFRLFPGIMIGLNVTIFFLLDKIQTKIGFVKYHSLIIHETPTTAPDRQIDLSRSRTRVYYLD